MVKFSRHAHKHSKRILHEYPWSTRLPAVTVKKRLKKCTYLYSRFQQRVVHFFEIENTHETDFTIFYTTHVQLAVAQRKNRTMRIIAYEITLHQR